ncbi:transmembrane protein 126A [Discoglossus pictus]
MSEQDVRMNSSVKNEQTFPRGTIAEFLAERFERLPENDRKLFAYGSVYLGINGAFAGLIGNSLFRRILNVSQARFTSSLPMAVLPFLTTVAAYNATVCEPLLSGDLNCATCAVVRGGLVGSVVGGLYPILLALPINGGLASRYQTAPLPEKGNIIRFLTTISRPVLKKMSFVLILQAMFGVYISSRHYTIYEKMLKLPPAGMDVEELPQ